MAVKTSRLEKITRAFRGLRVGVLGDLMLDELVRGEATRISPEAPVPVVLVRDGRDGEGFLGGSGNVAANVAALGGRAAVFGAIGRDASAQKLKALLRQREIDTGGVVEEANRITPRKVRIVAHQHQLLRVDFEQPQALSPESSELLAGRLARRVASLDALIISDYAKGSVTADLCSSAMAAARRRNIPVLVDPKPEHTEICRNATVVTPNQREAEQMAGTLFADPIARRSDGPALLEKLGCEALLITRGGEGMTLVEAGGRVHDIPSVPRPVYDVTGAGDTVISVMALSLAAGASLEEAAHLANLAGGCVVLKFGTAVIAPDELLAAVRVGHRGAC
jgi:D-beta-D-heptose 7-phosphate kinase/D-beta-D-heptose 1-phosphate adenosyltransferase